MSEKTKNSVSPYDLHTVHRSAPGVELRAPSVMRQPYTLSSSQRLNKSTAVLLRPKKSA